MYNLSKNERIALKQKHSLQSRTEVNYVIDYCETWGFDPLSDGQFIVVQRFKHKNQYIECLPTTAGLISIAQKQPDWKGFDDLHVGKDESGAYCIITAVRDGKRFPARIHEIEFVRKNANGEPIGKWKKPELALQSLAKAVAIRDAYASLLSGCYVYDELAFAIGKEQEEFERYQKLMSVSNN